MYNEYKQYIWKYGLSYPKWIRDNGKVCNKCCDDLLQKGILVPKNNEQQLLHIDKLYIDIQNKISFLDGLTQLREHMILVSMRKSEACSFIKQISKHTYNLQKDKILNDINNLKHTLYFHQLKQIINKVICGEISDKNNNSIIKKYVDETNSKLNKILLESLNFNEDDFIKKLRLEDDFIETV